MPTLSNSLFDTYPAEQNKTANISALKSFDEYYTDGSKETSMHKIGVGKISANLDYRTYKKVKTFGIWIIFFLVIILIIFLIGFLVWFQKPYVPDPQPPTTQRRLIALADEIDLGAKTDLSTTRQRVSVKECNTHTSEVVEGINVCKCKEGWTGELCYKLDPQIFGSLYIIGGMTSDVSYFEDNFCTPEEELNIDKIKESIASTPDYVGIYIDHDKQIFRLINTCILSSKVKFVPYNKLVKGPHVYVTNLDHIIKAGYISVVNNQKSGKKVKIVDTQINTQKARSKIVKNKNLENNCLTALDLVRGTGPVSLLSQGESVEVKGEFSIRFLPELQEVQIKHNNTLVNVTNSPFSWSVSDTATVIFVK